MKNNIKESAEFYREVERLVLVTAGIRILDLGCGTGLELDEIFRLNTTARIACVDLSQKMLEILRIKHEDRLDSLNLITGSYFEVDFPSEEFALPFRFSRCIISDTNRSCRSTRRFFTV